MRIRNPFMKHLVRVFVPVCAAAAIIIFLFSRRQSPSFEVSVPVSVLMEDQDIAHLGLLGVIDGALANEMLEAVDHLPFILDETLDELTAEEKSMLIERMRKKYGYEVPG
jgi:H+/Cl- antiporter ClcA